MVLSTREPSVASATLVMVTAVFPSPKEVTGTSRTAEVSWTDMTKRSPSSGLLARVVKATVADSSPSEEASAIAVAVYSVYGVSPSSVNCVTPPSAATR